MRSDDRRLIFEGFFFIRAFMDFLFFLLFLQSDGKAWRRSQAAEWAGKPGVCKLAANAVKCCFCACLFPREGNFLATRLLLLLL